MLRGGPERPQGAADYNWAKREGGDADYEYGNYFPGFHRKGYLGIFFIFNISA